MQNTSVSRVWLWVRFGLVLLFKYVRTFTLYFPGKVFRIGTVRYNWPMSVHASQAFSIAHCTDSEDLPFPDFQGHSQPTGLKTAVKRNFPFKKRRQQFLLRSQPH